MTWIHRYRLRRFLSSSAWIAPLLAVVAALALHRLAWWVDARTRWAWLGFTAEGGRAVTSAITTSTLTFMVFTFSIMLLSVQIAGAQLSPRVIAMVMRDRVLKWSLGLFVFAFILSVGVLGRVEDVVPQLPVLLSIVGCLASIAAFLYLVDYMMRTLRPAGILGKIGLEATSVIESSYPRQLAQSEGVPPEQGILPTVVASRTVYYQGKSGILQAVDAPGLAQVAHRNGCTIRLVPQVGDFITTGEPLFQICSGGERIDDRDMHHAIAVGMERTRQQDPLLAFRIIVDIALKALSPAINDPSTAVLALDQMHRLLRVLGRRHLGDGTIRDGEGVLRVIMPTPNWEDFVSIGLSEIRLSGASSIQVVRRLRAMIENLLTVLPQQRRPALHEQLTLLDRAVERSFADPADRAAAGISDLQGVGSSRHDHMSDGTESCDEESQSRAHAQ
jgi:uncharacterized membrane protein